MSLLEKIKTFPEYTGNNWAKYKEAYFFLIDEKNYPPKKAVAIIAKEEGINNEDTLKLYNSSKSWKRIGGGK